MTGHRALEKKQITQGNNRKVQNPSGSPSKRNEVNTLFLFFLCLKALITCKLADFPGWQAFF